MFLTSKAFTNGGRIPKKHTQEAQGAVKDVSPPLEWHNVPEDAVTLALVMEDPAPTESHAVDHWTHWYQIFMPPFVTPNVVAQIPPVFAVYTRSHLLEFLNLWKLASFVTVNLICAVHMEQANPIRGF